VNIPFAKSLLPPSIGPKRPCNGLHNDTVSQRTQVRDISHNEEQVPQGLNKPDKFAV